MKTYMELLAELERANETNRRLNRRCQYLESQVNLLYRQRELIPLYLELHRIRRYANKMRGLWYEDYQRSILRKQAAKKDSFATRIGHVLRVFFQ